MKWSPKPHGTAGPGIGSFGTADLKITHSLAFDPQRKVYCGTLGVWTGCCVADAACLLALYCGKDKRTLWQPVYFSQHIPESSLSSGGLPHLPSRHSSDPLTIHYHLSKENIFITLRDKCHQYLMTKDSLDDTKFSNIVIIFSGSLMSQFHRYSLSVLGMQ